MSYEDHLRWAFSIYTSSGLLDLNSNGSLSLKMIKDLICVPVYTSKRMALCNIIDEAWMKFSVIDYDCHKLTNKILNSIYNTDGNIDNIIVSYPLFSKFLMISDMNQYLQISSNGFTYVLEDTYFHPILLRKLKEGRKVFRIDKQVDLFIVSKLERIKKYALMGWKRMLKTYVHYLYIYMYIYMCVCIHICISIYIFFMYLSVYILYINIHVSGVNLYDINWLLCP
jgi:hypothetical protein